MLARAFPPVNLYCEHLRSFLLRNSNLHLSKTGKYYQAQNNKHLHCSMKVLVKGVVVSPDEPVKSGSSIGEKRSRGDIIVGFYCSLEI